MSDKKVAIVGAGVSGLAALKICLDYGFDAYCFEKRDSVGGLWNFKEEECAMDEACVMKSTVTNTSKEMMAYSDFPPPETFPNFMHNRVYLNYIQQYAQRFKLLERIRFNVRIVSIRRTADHEETGQWLLQWTNDQPNATVVETFDAVMLCNGHHAEPYVPPFEGLQTFKGRIVHSHNYKDHKGFENKRVIVVGIGNSGGDAAVELSTVASECYMVARRGSWVYNRLTDGGLPFDVTFSTRFNAAIRRVSPKLAEAFVQYKMNSRYNHKLMGLEPDYSIFQQHPFINDELPHKILFGLVRMKPGIRRVDKDTVEFADGTALRNVDALVMCTGYSFGYTLLEDGQLLPVHDNKFQLYKNMFLPQLSRPETLAVIGLVQPNDGPIVPVAEMQCRLFCETLLGRVRLPDRSEMQQDIDRYNKSLKERYVYSRRYSLEISALPYMDAMASLFGAKPNIGDYFLSDPRLALALTFGPALPYHYRLIGPHSWPGARDAILNVRKRVWAPTEKRPKKQSTFIDYLSENRAILIVVSFILFVFYMFFL